MPSSLKRLLRNKVTLATLGSVTFIPLFLLYYTSTLDESDDTPLPGFNLLCFFFSFIAAGNAAIETTDTFAHLWSDESDEDHSHNHHHHNGDIPQISYGSIDTERRSHSGPSPCFFGLRAIATALVLISAPLATFGLFMQDIEMAQAIRGGGRREVLGIAAVSTLLQLPYYVFIPAIHCFKNIQGSYESFMAGITRSRGPVTGLRKKSARALLFVFLAAIHLPDGFLLSQELGKLNKHYDFYINKSVADALQISAAGTFAIYETIVHIDHLSAVMNAWSAWKNRTRCSKSVTAITGIISGFAHSGPALLSTIHYWNSPDLTTQWLTRLLCFRIGVDASLGKIEHHMHGALAIDNMLQHVGRPFFKQQHIHRFISAERNEEPEIEMDDQILLVS